MIEHSQGQERLLRAKKITDLFFWPCGLQVITSRCVQIWKAMATLLPPKPSPLIDLFVGFCCVLNFSPLRWTVMAPVCFIYRAIKAHLCRNAIAAYSITCFPALINTSHQGKNRLKKSHITAATSQNLSPRQRMMIFFFFFAGPWCHFSGKLDDLH